MRWHLGILLLLLHFCSSSAVLAQHYPFQTYTELDGLPSSAVHAINQDNLGQMWFATRSGLVVFDGLEWKVQGTDQGLPDRVYGHLQKDDLGRIWTVSMRSPIQVAYLEGDNWVLLPFLELEFSGWTIHDFKVARQPQGQLFAAVVADSGFLSIWDGNTWRQIGSGSIFKTIYSVEFQENRLFISSANGLFALDLTTWTLDGEPLPGLPSGPVMTITINEADSPICIVGNNWIGRHHQGHFELLVDDLDIFLPEKHKGVKALRDQAGGIYFGDNHRLYFFSSSTGQLEPITKSSGHISGGTTCLFQDREGNIWFSTLRGVSKLISRRFTHFDSQNGLFKDEVSAIEVKKSGQVVLGHESGLTFFGPEFRVMDIARSNQLLGRVIDLEEDAQGTLWIAADRQGLASLDNSGNLVWYGAEDGLVGAVFAIHFDQKGQMLIGGNDGIFRRKNGHFEPVFLPGLNQESPPFIRRIQPGRHGSILVVAGIQGVFRLFMDQVHHWAWDNSPDHSLYAAFEISDGTLWVGTSDGLYKTVNDKLVKTTQPDPVINRPIYSIVQGPSDKLWFGTDSGVIIWDGVKLRHYTPREGLLGGETNRDALKIDNQGHMLIGTDRGLSVYSEEYSHLPTVDPIVEFLSFEVNDEVIAQSDKVVIDNPSHSLVAHFRSISFGNLHNWGIGTWLENYEPTWQKPGQWSKREIRYTNLPPGKYCLHLRFEKSCGYTGEVISSPEILVCKPFWIQWWFILLGIVFVILLFRIALSYYSNKRYSLQLEKEIRVQTKELRETEQFVRAESQKFSTTLDSISEGVLTLDADNKIVLCNPAAESILGLSTSALLGKTCFDVIPQLTNTKTKPSGQSQYVNPERGTIWLETTFAPITSADGQKAGQVMVLRDITERRAQNYEQRKVQKLESLGLLAGGIAHDFNNLLTIIYGNVELTQTTPWLPNNCVVRLEKAKQAINRASSLTEQLLTFARGGAPKKQVTSMVDIVKQTSSLVFSGKAQSYEISMEKDLWHVFVDPGQMNQVLSNLFINACQATTGGGTVLIKGRNIAEAPEDLPSGRYVLIEIKDQGLGIPRRNIAKIFDPYFTTKEQGSGLGLATSYSIISRHNGSIKVQSEEDKGTTFQIYLPYCPDVPVPQLQEPALPIAPGQRILIMDDEEDVCLVIESFLAQMGLETEITNNGEDAITAYISAQKEGKDFAAVLFDMTIPGAMGGKEAVSKLLKINPQLKSIVISGYSKDAVMANFSSYGFSAALPKPFDFKGLSAVLARVLGSDVSHH